jgi:hypothetical protein
VADLDRRDKQRTLALKKANKIRRDRSKLKVDVREGRVDGIALIRGDLPRYNGLIAEWQLAHLIRMVPGIGASTEQEIYAVGRFVPTMRLSALSAERRAYLAELCSQGKREYGR